MSKFPNQLALVGVVGVSAIALSVGLSERAAQKAAETARAEAVHAAEVAATEVDQVEQQDVVTEEVAVVEAEADTATADTTAAEVVEEAEAETAPAAEEVAATEEAPAETTEEAAAPAAVATLDGATDTLEGQGDTDLLAGEDTAAPHGPFGLGRPALPEEVHAWNRDIMPDGTGLPDGEGDVWTGEEIFAEYCAVCHGDFAEGVDNWPKLAGGMNTLDREDPLKTVGSFWPYLSTTYDYVRRSMPFGNAQTLTDDEVYSIVSYILYSNDLVDEDFVLSKETFLDVEMPNADGFILDDRAETELERFSQDPCMENCKESVEITMRAAVLDVTPEETRAKTIAKLIKDTDPKAPKAAAPAAAGETEMAAAEAPEAAPAATEEAAPAAEAAAPAADTAAPATDAAAPDPELVAAGEKVFKKCQACHQVGEDAQNKVGPVLNGIVGRQTATVEGFKYSKAMIEAGEGGLVWDEATLHEYLADPKAYIKGNKMSFAGLKKTDDADAVIAYLKAHP